MRGEDHYGTPPTPPGAWVDDSIKGRSVHTLHAFTKILCQDLPVALVATGVLASYLPARRAVRQDPWAALRHS